MTVSEHKPGQARPILAIVGATATGKNELAQTLAAQINATLVSVDSRKVYRGLDIGTAKPSPEVQRRFDYAMIDRVDPDEPFSAGRYAREARQIVGDRLTTGRPVIMVGGTGFYLDTFIRGLADLPQVTAETRAEVMAEAKKQGWRAVHEQLMAVDPQFAERVHPEDRTRVLRGMEIFRQTGRPLSQFFADRSRDPLPWPIVVVWVDLPANILGQHIDDRVDRMIEAGLIDEVRTLATHGYGSACPGMATVGYQEILKHLSGRLTFNEAVGLIRRNTRRYAKRQRTWFRHRDYVRAVSTEGNVAQRIAETWSGSMKA